MCKDCGCGAPGAFPASVSAHHHGHEHESGHGHAHDHGHGHHHEHPHPHFHPPGEPGHNHEPPPPPPPPPRRQVEIRQPILDKNDRQAERNRGLFQAHALLVLNVLSSPGSGKTTFLRETVRALAGRLQAAVIVGDLATDNDARRLRESGAPVVQITTGTVCHLEAEMVARALKQLDLASLDLLIIENVGNLVCPASYDLGEDLRIVLLSVTEGEDKPLKYPPMFQSADVAIVSKLDLAQACDYDHAAALANLHKAAPRARLFETAAKTGQGLAAWCDFLVAESQRRKADGKP